LSIKALWKPLNNQVHLKPTCALVAGFMKKQHLGIGILSSASNALIKALVDDAMQLSLEVSHIP